MKSVVIVGRPNVGKSTLFNKIIGKRKALIHPKPGMTRDLITHQFGKWAIIDSGGIDFGTENFSELILRQVFYAVEEADLILFLLDGKEGIVSTDLDIAQNLRKKNKKVFVVWNKIDSKEALNSFHQAYALGFKDVFKISAEHNIGIEDLKNKIEKELKVEEEEKEKERDLKIAILGKPNVGKSSLLNSLIGKERVLVSPIPGTTRDPVEIKIKYYGKNFIFIDTAGEKREQKIKEEQDLLSVLRTKKALENSDIVLFLLDASTQITNQDREIAFEIEKNYKGFIFVANKVDLINEDQRDNFKENLYKTFPYFDYVPIVFVSALKKYNLNKIWKYILELQEALNYRISTGVLNRSFREIISRNPLKERKFYYITQADVLPPTFVIMSNNKKKLSPSFIRFLQTGIRKIYPFKGVPIKILLKKR